MGKKLPVGLALTILPCLSVASFLLQSPSIQRQAGTVTKVNTGNVIQEEEVAFGDSTASDDMLLSYDVLTEKVAVNPNYIYEEFRATLYALNNTEVYDSPVEKKQNSIFNLEKRQVVNVIGYNDFNNTFKVIREDGTECYLHAEDFANDKNLILDEASGTKYVAGNYALKSYPSEDSDNIKDLPVNNTVEVIAENDNNYYKVRYDGVEGFITKDKLSDSKVNYVTDAQRRVAEVARNNSGSYPCIGGYCAAWVSGVYDGAGYGWPGGNAIDYWLQWNASGSTRMDNIPVGAVVCGSGSGSSAGNMYGHVAVYIGDGLVAENIGYHRIISLSEWVTTQRGTCRGYHGYIGWVWPYNQPLGEGL